MECPATHCSTQTDPPSNAVDLTHPPPQSGKFAVQPLRDPTAILLVARDHSLHDACRRALSDAGFTFIFSVSNCDRAHELIGSKLFDAVVIGIGAGDVRAVSLAQYMQQRRPDLPTFVVSSLRRLPIEGTAVETASVERANANLNSLGRTMREVVSARHSGQAR